MNPEERSLRSLIEKWLGPTPATPVRLTRYGRVNSSQIRCVLAQSSEPTRALSIFFFRHDDGGWCVFPPAVSGPVMRPDAPTGQIAREMARTVWPVPLEV
jgi:hypothetical protein